MEIDIDIAKILKNKPINTKLYSPLFGDVYTSSICNEDTIIVVKHNTEVSSFYNNGKYFNYVEAEPLLFPSKEMRNWSKFSWKKGDILINKIKSVFIIFNEFEDNTYKTFKGKYCLTKVGSKEEYTDEESNFSTFMFEKATDIVAQNYINIIEKKFNGKLNYNTLKIEKLKFKDGDILSCNEDSYTRHTTLILHKDENVTESIISLVRHKKLIEDTSSIDNFLLSRLHYAKEDEKKELFDALAKEGKAWDAEKKQIVDLKPKAKLKPFDKVLVRDSKSDKWRANLLSYIDKDEYYHCVYANWAYCIPYIGNESLLGTTKNVED